MQEIMLAFDPSAGGAVQGRVAPVVARDQEAASALVDHLGAVEEVLAVAAGCDDVEEGVPLVAGHTIKEMQQWSCGGGRINFQGDLCRRRRCGRSRASLLVAVVPQQQQLLQPLAVAAASNHEQLGI